VNGSEGQIAVEQPSSPSFRIATKWRVRNP
jgi:hypothetical protein